MTSAGLGAVLFDLDGTLVDSVAALRLAYHRFLARHGRRGADEEFDRWIGPPLSVVVAGLAQSHALDGPAEALLAEYLVEVEARYLEAPLFPSVKRLFEGLAERGVATAVVTSAPASLARPLLAVRGVLGSLGAVVCADDVSRGKPSGDGYREALRRLGVDAKRAIAVEDSARGVEAARDAGLRCIGIAAEARRSTLVRAGACAVVEGFADAAAIVVGLLDGPGRTWPAREVVVRRAGEPTEWDDETHRRVDAIWAAARAERPGLFDGRQLVVTAFRDEGPRLSVDVAEVPYRFFYAQHRGVPLGLTALGVTGVVLPRDDDGGDGPTSVRGRATRVVLGRRSPGVTQHVGAWELIPAGSLSGERVGADGVVDVRGQFLEELDEELGVSAERVERLEVLGIVESIDDAVLDVAISVELRASDAELAVVSATRPEYEVIRVEAAAEIEAELGAVGSRRFVPTVGPLLSLIARR